ncbi:MAG: isopenicillin-N epimerase [Pseudomonadota bacterium]
MFPSMPTFRTAFALVADVAPLNHGSYGAVPRAVSREQDTWRGVMEADPVAFMEQLGPRLRAAAEGVASLLDRSGEDLVFVENATAGVCAVLASHPWRPGDRVVTTDHAYGAVRRALDVTAHRHGLVVDVVHVPFPVSGPDEVLARLVPRLPGATLLVIDAITSPTALRFPVGELVAHARRLGVAVLVDAAHAPGHIEVWESAVDADYWVGNLHKWCFAPRGTAVLTAAPKWRSTLRPTVVSHGYDDGWLAAFDGLGTRDPTPWLTAPYALSWYRAWGETALRDGNRRRAVAIAALLAERWGQKPLVPLSMDTAMAIVAPPRPVAAARAADLHAALRRRGVQVPCTTFGGRTWVRVSAQAYVQPADVERLAAVIDDAIDALGA